MITDPFLCLLISPSGNRLHLNDYIAWIGLASFDMDDCKITVQCSQASFSPISLSIASKNSFLSGWAKISLKVSIHCSLSQPWRSCEEWNLMCHQSWHQQHCTNGWTYLLLLAQRKSLLAVAGKLLISFLMCRMSIILMWSSNGSCFFVLFLAGKEINEDQLVCHHYDNCHLGHSIIDLFSL